MGYPVRAIAGMPRSLMDALAERGITDTDALLTVARSPRQRRDLAAAIGVDASDLDLWASVADLVRVASLPPMAAELVVRSGVARSVQELALALPAEVRPVADPLDLGAGPMALDVEARLRAYAARHGLAASVPWTHELRQAGDEARDLRPRLVTRATPIEADIEAKLAQVRAKTLRNDRRTFWRLLVFLSALAGLGAAFVTWSLRQQADQGFDTLLGDGLPNEAVPFIETLRSVFMAYLTANAWALVAMLAGVMLTFVALFLAHRLVTEGWRWLGTRVVLRTYEARAAYTDLLGFEATKLDYLSKVLWATIGAAAVLGVGFVIASPDEMDRRLVLVLAAIVPPAIVAVFWPSTRYLMRRWRTHGALSAPVVRNVVAFNVFAVVVQVGFVITTLYAFPQALRVAGNVSTAVFQHRTAAVDAAYASELERHAEHWSPSGHDGDTTGLIADVRGRLAGLGDLWSELPDEIARTLTSFGTYLTPSLVLAAVFAVVFPFLILGGWLRGAFFVLLLAAVSWTELGAQRYVTANLTRWFALDANAGIVPLLVGIAVFGNAIVFEWIYELVLERRSTCEECGAEVERGAAFCPACGMVRGEASRVDPSGNGPPRG
jgi:hypothetical protein